MIYQYKHLDMNIFIYRRYNQFMSKIVNEIKNLAGDRDITLKELARRIGEMQNKQYSLASLSQKLRKETISYKEVKLIAQILGYKITFVDLITRMNRY